MFAAAPTIALLTLVLTASKQGSGYVAVEARSMIAGAIAFFAYACAVRSLLMRRRQRAVTVAAELNASLGCDGRSVLGNLRR